LVPEDNSNPTKHIQIQNISQLDSSLLQRNIEHFQQADGTPFTTPLLTDYNRENGCNDNSDAVIQGTVRRQNLPKFVTLLLQHFNKQHKEPLNLHFTFDDMCHGFMKWRERTTTSPSGKHLGIYRSFIQIINHRDQESSKIIYDTALKCLQIQISVNVNSNQTLSHIQSVEDST
jgi:hypothetical protein